MPLVLQVKKGHQEMIRVGSTVAIIDNSKSVTRVVVDVPAGAMIFRTSYKGDGMGAVSLNVRVVEQALRSLPKGSEVFDLESIDKRKYRVFYQYAGEKWSTTLSYIGNFMEPKEGLKIERN